MNREFPIENLPHEAPGAQNISLFEVLIIFILLLKIIIILLYRNFSLTFLSVLCVKF